MAAADRLLIGGRWLVKSGYKVDTRWIQEYKKGTRKIQGGVNA